MREFKDATIALNVRLKLSGFSVDPCGDGCQRTGATAAADSASAGALARGNETNAKRLSRRRGADKFYRAR
jgi:hypothetical protein